MRSYFLDRKDAGRQLAQQLLSLKGQDCVVLALPRGGVPVAFEVAQKLDALLDLVLVRKIGAPGHAEYGIGAVVDGDDPQVFLNSPNSHNSASQDYIDAETQKLLVEIERRRSLYLQGRAPLALEAKIAVVVDDGIATGATMKAALRAIAKRQPNQICLAVPVAPPSVIESLMDEVDVIICLLQPTPFLAVGQHYRVFDQVSDQEVIACMQAASGFGTGGALR